MARHRMLAPDPVVGRGAMGNATCSTRPARPRDRATTGEVCRPGRRPPGGRRPAPRRGQDPAASGERVAYGVRGLGRAPVGEHPGGRLLEVEHVDGLRPERVDVRGAHRDVEAGQRRADQVQRRPGRSAARTSRTVAWSDASGRTTTVGSRDAAGAAGPQPAGRVDPALHDRLVALPQHRGVEVGLADLPHRHAVLLLRPGAGRADRDPLRARTSPRSRRAARPGPARSR